MGHERVRYGSMGWAPGGHPLERKKLARRGGATLLSFEAGFEDPRWCGSGHAGYVVEGVLGFRYAVGDDDRIGAGEGFVIEPGTRHRAFNPGPGPVVVFIVPRG